MVARLWNGKEKVVARLWKGKEKLVARLWKGKVWTTDAFFRETRAKMERRKATGCICVDMECSAMAAVAQFRKKDIFHFFYAEDNLDAEIWDKRSLGSDERFNEKDCIAQLAFEFGIWISGLD